jgi:O-antigen ligase
VAVSVIVSYARGATLTMLVFLFACIIAFVLYQIVMPHEQRRPITVLVLILIFGSFIGTSFSALRVGEAWERISAGVTRKDGTLAEREWVTKATWSMFKEHWITGAGAGSFRFVFPIYQHRDPRLVTAPDGRQLYWEQAHNDIAQFSAELGVFGTGIIVIGLGWWFVRLIQNYFWANALSASGVGGLLLLLTYSWWDFPLQCPAILITWCALWPSITLWTQFEEHGRDR